jgi:light-regulated signal transduction histidine kinase (bacteriophytochrome)
LHRLNAELGQQALEHATHPQSPAHELASFAHTIARDLRASLRTVAGFSGLLLRGYAPDLPPDAQRYLQFVQRNGEHLGSLLDELLAVVCTACDPLPRETVVPTALVRSALADLQAEQTDRQVNICIAELPPCQANPTLLKQVYVHLLDNALKFTRSRTVARIDVGAQWRADRWEYFVKDNGVGFDSQHVPQLFEVFARLHPGRDYEGNGIGLAVVQRIIQHHGGHVWAEATVDQGATFYFTLTEETSNS